MGTTHGQILVAEELDTIPVGLRSEGRYSELVNYLNVKRDTLEKEGQTESLTYALMLLDLSGVKALTGDCDSERDIELALNYIEGLDVEWLSYWIATLSCVGDFNKAKCYDRSLQIMRRQKKYCENKYGAESEETCKSILNLAENSYLSGDYDLVEEYCKEGIKRSETRMNDEVDLYDMFVMYLNNVYELKRVNGVDRLREQIDLQLAQLKRTEQKKSVDPEMYLYQLYNLASLYFDVEEYDEAMRYAYVGMEKAEQLIGKDNENYADLAGLYIIAKKLSGNLNEVTQMQLENLQRRETLLDKDSEYYYRQTKDIAADYARMYRYEDAIRVITALLREIKESEGETSQNYSDALEALVSYKMSNEDYGDCVTLLNRAIELNKLRGDYKYLITEMSLSTLYYNLGEYLKAIETSENILKDLEAFATDEQTAKLMSALKQSELSTLSNSYSRLGNKQKAAYCQLELLRLIEKETGQTYPDSVTAELMAEMEGREYAYTPEDIALIEELNKEELAMLEEYGQLDTPEYPSYLLDCATPYILTRQYDQALRYIEESLESYKRLNYSHTLDYADCLEIYANCCQAMGKKAEAIDAYRKSLTVKEGKLPGNHPDVLSLKTRIATLGYLNGEASISKYAIEVSDELRSLLITNFAQLTSVDRNMYWNKYKDWFQKELLIITAGLDNEDLLETAYDGILLSKGLLLNTDMEFAKLIADSDNSDLLNKYYKLSMLRTALNQTSDMSADEYQRKETETRILEKELIEASKQYGDYTRNLDVKWNNVKERLGDGCVAVEFVSYPSTNNRLEYAAFIVSPDKDKPSFEKLFDESELKRVSPSTYYSTPDLSRLIWGRLDNIIKDARTIFFAPTGELYNIAIETLPMYEGDGMMTDRFNLRRLSSTRELAKQTEKKDYQRAFLYGGMQFDETVASLQQDMANYPMLANRAFSFDAQIAETLRGGVSDLPGTAIEVDNISQSFDGSTLRPTVYKGLQATEASLKSLSGTDVNLMHIATHGFYWTESEAKKLDGLSFLAKENAGSAYYAEDRALTRSGLLFTGANNALAGIAVPDGVEDGVLTAQEISKLDLRGLDLVVMSACQTGLGEITGEGVFGLQRGFKKAGANTMMMSLWKVDDQATQMLMTKFYDEFLHGKSKSEALTMAQHFVRTYEKEVEIDSNANLTASQRRRKEAQGESLEQSIEKKISRPYEDPKYWAAFILLDAID
ncbi:MAG: CHAT domain-containing protein [Muribaculaceae bacterium]|nr:CHAT domain-containing protein [Muribaculaceae bacterium]